MIEPPVGELAVAFQPPAELGHVITMQPAKHVGHIMRCQTGEHRAFRGVPPLAKPASDATLDLHAAVADLLPPGNNGAVRPLGLRCVEVAAQDAPSNCRPREVIVEAVKRLDLLPALLGPKRHSTVGRSQ